MTNPDDFPTEFPAKGTWSVNQRMLTHEYFITEAQGDGTSTMTPVPYSPYAAYDPKYCDILEQICARHNEALREGG